MDEGESPYECALRETFEETGHRISTQDLHLFAMIAEKSYEGGGHWLLFLFDCQKPIDSLPPAISEGVFSFYTREAIAKLRIPETDKEGLWETYDKHHKGFVALKADCDPAKKLKFCLEECH